jgi:hypothetical protein
MHSVSSKSGVVTSTKKTKHQLTTDAGSLSREFSGFSANGDSRNAALVFKEHEGTTLKEAMDFDLIFPRVRETIAALDENKDVLKLR